MLLIRIYNILICGLNCNNHIFLANTTFLSTDFQRMLSLIFDDFSFLAFWIFIIIFWVMFSFFSFSFFLFVLFRMFSYFYTWNCTISSVRKSVLVRGKNMVIWPFMTINLTNWTLLCSPIGKVTLEIVCVQM